MDEDQFLVILEQVAKKPLQDGMEQLEYFKDTGVFKPTIKKLFNSLVQDVFNSHKNFVFKNPKPLHLIVILLPFLKEVEQSDVLDTLIVVFEESSMNCALASQCGIIERIFEVLRIPTLTQGSIQKIIYLVGILGSHSIKVKELKGLIHLIRGPNNQLSQDLSPLIFEYLRKMTRSVNPSSYFHFDGVDGGLANTAPIPFTSSAYSFSCWIRLERSYTTPTRIYSFFDKKGNGCEVFFKANHLYVQTIYNQKAKGCTFHFFFNSNRWYHVALTHTTRWLLQSPILTIYIDGELKETSKLDYPYITTDLEYLTIGSNTTYTGNPVQAFSGQMGSFAFFDKSLTSQEIRKMFSMGSDFLFVFRKNETPYFDKDIESLNSNLVLLYHPRSCVGRMCMDHAKNYSPVKLLNGTNIFISHHVRDTLACIGGTSALYPIFYLLTSNWTKEYSMCARILSLLGELMKFQQDSDYQTLGFIIGDLQVEHVNMDTLKSLQAMLVDAPLNNSSIPLLDHIFFNWGIWKNENVITERFVFLRLEIAKNPKYYRQYFGRVLDGIKLWHGENRVHRTHLFEMIKAMLYDGIRIDEFESLLSFLFECKNDALIHEMLIFLFILLDSDLPKMQSYFINVKYYLPFLNLCRVEDKPESKVTRLYALKILAKLLPNLDVNVYSLIEYHFKDAIIDLETYTTLMDMMTSHTTFKITNTFSSKLSDKTKITFPNVLQMLFHCKLEDPALFLSDLKFLVKNVSNAAALAKGKHWISWILSFMNQGDSIMDELCIEVITSTLYSLFKEWKGYQAFYTIMDQLTDANKVVMMYRVVGFFVNPPTYQSNDPFWNNTFYYLKYIVMLIQTTSLGPSFKNALSSLPFDALIKNSNKDFKLLQLLHFSFESQESIFKQITGQLTNLFGSFNLTLFVLLFEIYTFLQDKLRMMGLLCMDVDHPQIPKPVQTITDNNRVWYIFARLVKELKINLTFLDIMNSFMTKNAVIINDQFKLPINLPITEKDFYSSDWEKMIDSDIVKNSLVKIDIASSQLDKEVVKYPINLVESLSRSFQNMVKNEIKRLNNVNDSFRRSRQITLSEFKKYMQDVVNEKGSIWFVDKKDEIWQVDEIETPNRMRRRLTLDPNGIVFNDTIVKTEKEEKENTFKLKSIMDVNQQEGKNTLQEDDLVVESKDEKKIEKIDITSFETVESSFFESFKKGDNEETLCILDCEWITSMSKIQGNFEMTYQHFYFFSQSQEMKISLQNVKEIYKRRYLLEYTAIEIFCDEKSYLINFNKLDIEFVFKQLFDMKSRMYSVYPHLSKIQIHNHLLNPSKWTEKWVRREISNFDYLMALNTIANRTYNDLTQYPVFPWVLTDYTSEKIDLNDPKVYRDLSKPIGALGKRVDEVISRYEGFMDPEIPKFHYGSHYSSIGTVLYFLIRLEPYTSNHRDLQGGHFDLPDRLFHSIPATWNNALSSLSDVKELIPEMYYLPEMFENINQHYFGVKQNKEKLDTVVLPPWAKTPEEFIRIQRDALESEHVSKHLHAWIDLIFGFKQRGPEAVKALNVFYYLTYEGCVDMNEITDPMMRKAIEAQISNFGQTPSQLFFKPHPKRNEKKQLRIEDPYLSNWLQVMNLNSPIFFVGFCDGYVCVLNSDRELKRLEYNNGKLKPINQIYLIGLPFATDAIVHSFCFTILDRNLISCGHFDKSLRVTSFLDMKIKQSIFMKDIITCVSSSKDWMTCAGRDCTIQMYQTNKGSDVYLTYMKTFYGHENPILCMDMDKDLDTLVSGDTLGSLMIHSLLSGRLIRTIQVGSPVHLVKLSSQGQIIVHSNQYLILYSLNGKKLFQKDLMDKIYAMEVVGNWLICGGQNRMLKIFGIWDLECRLQYDPCSHSIRCLYYKEDQDVILAGLSDGKMVFFKGVNGL